MISGGQIHGHLELGQLPLTTRVVALVEIVLQLPLVEEVPGEQHKLRVNQIDVVHHLSQVHRLGRVGIRSLLMVVEVRWEMSVGNVDEVVRLLEGGAHMDRVRGGVIDPTFRRHPQVVELEKKLFGDDGFESPPKRGRIIGRFVNGQRDLRVGAGELRRPTAGIRLRDATDPERVARRDDRRYVQKWPLDDRQRVPDRQRIVSTRFQLEHLRGCFALLNGHPGFERLVPSRRCDQTPIAGRHSRRTLPLPIRHHLQVGIS